jgi:hypothetical protein
MPTSSGQIKLLARLTAAEVLIEHLLFMVASSKPDAAAELEAYRLRVLAEHAEATIRGFDPVTSDLLAGELSEALDALLRKTVDRARASQQPPQSGHAPAKPRKS